jgi:hypothetical protein
LPERSDAVQVAGRRPINTGSIPETRPPLCVLPATLVRFGTIGSAPRSSQRCSPGVSSHRSVVARERRGPRFPGASWNRAIGPTHLSSPVIADVNRDGHPDIVTADLSGWVHVLDGRNGRDLGGWPQPVQVIPGQTVAVESSPTVVDLAHNGRPATSWARAASTSRSAGRRRRVQRQRACGGA